MSCFVPPNTKQQFDSGDSDTIVGYHAYCPDGVGAAWVYYHEALNNPDAQMPAFVPLTHNHPVPHHLFRGKHVILVDFAYPKKTIVEIHKEATSLIVLDHHKTSADELRDLPYCHFTMSKSGAQIAWDHVFPKKFRPWFINYIADRDLYVWKLPNSKEITKGMYEENCYCFETLEEIFEDTYRDKQAMKDQKSRFARIGKQIMNRERQFIKKAVNKAVLSDFKGPDGTTMRAYLTQCAPCVRSEVGNILSVKRECQFACIYAYSFEHNEWWLSFRSTKGKANVGKIAASFPTPDGKKPGGGHTAAAGCSVYGGSLWDYFTPCHPKKS